MRRLLEAMGRRVSLPSALMMGAEVGLVFTLAMSALMGVARWSAGAACVAQLMLWSAWLAWLRFVFPHAPGRARARDPRLPYRAAFYTQVLPGISTAFVLLAFPFAFTHERARLMPAPIPTALLAIALVGAVALIRSAVCSIGVARALFVEEFVGHGHPELLQSGVYRLFRHPMFLGGLLLSVAGFAWCNNALAAQALIVNLIAFPLYVRAEDHRCIRLFGVEYLRYVTEVSPVHATTAPREDD